ncbi:porin family protein [Aquimarina sp. 2201CG1-2-11]|uniref:porin family protein n=1 Tax=Aquimarina discodermiae TaxID=3231043 RepID=UPI003461F00C
MKKSILWISAIFMFATLHCFAQEEVYGIRIGGNLSSISSDDIPENLEDSRFGIVVGFLAEYPLKGKFSIQPEFQYSSMGNDDESLRVDYLQFPVFLKYNISELVNIHIGPQAGVKIWEWQDNTSTEVSFNTFNFSTVTGVGVDITENFFVDLRYGFGFSNIIDDTNISDSEGTTRNIQLSFGYKL